jgi:hypothetical protein
MKTNLILNDRQIAIRNGETYAIMVFAQDPGDESTYYVWEPEPSAAGAAVAKIPGRIKFTDPHEFYVEVRWANDSKRMRFDANVVRDYDGRLQYRFRP